MADSSPLVLKGGRPSSATKERLTHIIEQSITETGKLARNLCQRSNSREVGRITAPSTSLSLLSLGFDQGCKENGLTRRGNGKYIKCKSSLVAELCVLSYPFL